MRWCRNGGYYQLRLIRGEDILEELAGFVRARRLRSGLLVGIGAATDIELGSFDPHRRRYRKRRFQDDYEVAALVGNISWDGKEPFCHVHVIISDSRCVTYSGHLFRAKVTATCEISILPGKSRLLRQLEPDIGLKLLQI